MRKSSTDVDVLIVGAGPVGLFFANECARRGMRYRIIEARASQSVHSKALAIMPRTFEVLDMAGLAAPFLEAANRVTSVALTGAKRTLARMTFTPAQSPYPFVAMVPQDVTERLLVEQLGQHGGEVEYNTSFVRAEQSGDCVRAVLECMGERTEIRAAFVVGCDGAHSAIRHMLNLSFDGGEYQDSFMLADVMTNDALAADEMQLCPSEDGPLAIFPMSAARRRVVATVEHAGTDAPSLQLVRELLARRAPAGIEARSLVWSSYFRIHHRHVKQMQVERIFVAGDAAHIHSPIGGQGMNTGLQDAWNLVWKLDLAVRGHAKSELLESYTAERRPIVKGVIELTDLMTKSLATANPLAKAVRDAVLPIASRLSPVQHAFVQRLSGLGIAYEGSPIVRGTGSRWFETSLRGGEGIKSRFLLLLGADTAASAAGAAKQLAERFSPVLEVRACEHDGLRLLRPDGYVAYEAGNGNPVRAISEIDDLLMCQTR